MDRRNELEKATEKYVYELRVLSKRCLLEDDMLTKPYVDSLLAFTESILRQISIEKGFRVDENSE